MHWHVMWNVWKMLITCTKGCAITWWNVCPLVCHHLMKGVPTGVWHHLMKCVPTRGCAITWWNVCPQGCAITWWNWNSKLIPISYSSWNRGITNVCIIFVLFSMNKNEDNQWMETYEDGIGILKGTTQGTYLKGTTQGTYLKRYHSRNVFVFKLESLVLHGYISLSDWVIMMTEVSL